MAVDGSPAVKNSSDDFCDRPIRDNEDIIVLTTFDERQGPLSVSSFQIPSSEIELSINIQAMCLGMSNINVDCGAPREFPYKGKTYKDALDPDYMMVQSLPSGHYVFYYHFQIYDFQGRGNIRRMALAYITTEMNKLLHNYDFLATKFKALAGIICRGSEAQFISDENNHRPRLRATLAVMQETVEALKALPEPPDLTRPIPQKALRDAGQPDEALDVCCRQSPLKFIKDVENALAQYEALTEFILSRSDGHTDRRMLERQMTGQSGDRAFVHHSEFYNTSRSEVRDVTDLFRSTEEETRREIEAVHAELAPPLTFHMIRDMDRRLCHAMGTERVFSSVIDAAAVWADDPCADTHTTLSHKTAGSTSATPSDGGGRKSQKGWSLPNLGRRKRAVRRAPQLDPALALPGNGLSRLMAFWQHCGPDKSVWQTVVASVVCGLMIGHSTVVVGADENAVQTVVNALALFVPTPKGVSNTVPAILSAGMSASGGWQDAVEAAPLTGMIRPRSIAQSTAQDGFNPAEKKRAERAAWALKCAVYDVDDHTLWPGMIVPEDALRFFSMDSSSESKRERKKPTQFPERARLRRLLFEERYTPNDDDMALSIKMLRTLQDLAIAGLDFDPDAGRERTAKADMANVVSYMKSGTVIPPTKCPNAYGVVDSAVVLRPSREFALAVAVCGTDTCGSPNTRSDVNPDACETEATSPARASKTVGNTAITSISRRTLATNY
ncbi:Vesicle coat protein involved in Golgi to plasma membrane transport [Carpediemonas membranifera]|uniref:Vesicle coat protein involved in Golgi to plasma membrane transport n=1 Tax=Carpediemonas membranifera TaxID=201153 RepID=A0A8J6B1R8_9EUKA|nr:Vesicle coat protein involved in Golgi to plasma membrane transport [Carpediemonas membranifera]|eukprot:KAG9393858.1 Vesicle coat protein involved in Golgi to plasma membrane transport [Carpediemonas membranifera]